MNNLSVVGTVIAASLAVAMALLGAATILLALRRRVGRMRVCAACEYPVDALPATTTRCPECGSDLTAAGGVAAGRRRRDWLPLAAGVALFLPVLAGVGLYATRAKPPAAPAVVSVIRAPPARFVAPSPPPNPYATLTEDQLADAILLDPPERDAMLAEASRRAVALKLPAVMMPAWTQRLIDAALARQRDESKPFDAAWATFAEGVLFDNSSAKWRDYLRAGLRFDVKLRRTIRLGSTFPIAIATRLRLSPELARRLQCRITDLSIGELHCDEALQFGALPSTEFPRSDGEPLVLPLKDLRTSDGKPAPLPLGEAVATVSILVRTAAWSSDWVERFEQPITVLPARPADPPPSDPALDQEIARRLRVSPSASGPDGDGVTWDGKTFRVALTLTDSPADICAQVAIVCHLDGHDHFLNFGDAQWKRGESATRTFECQWNELKPFIGKPIRIDFHGSPLHADSGLDDGDWWTGEIDFANVTLLDTAASATTRPSTPRASFYVAPAFRSPDRPDEAFRPIAPR